jgi:hypothetical protein
VGAQTTVDEVVEGVAVEVVAVDAEVGGTVVGRAVGRVGAGRTVVRVVAGAALLPSLVQASGQTRINASAATAVTLAPPVLPRQCDMHDGGYRAS